jgi:hypothetical protein
LKDLKTLHGLPPEIANNQNNVGKHWEDNPNWIGACDELAKLAKPTLVITGTDDDKYQPYVNSLKIVDRLHLLNYDHSR